MPLVFDCDSAFFGKFEEFYWLKSNPLSPDSMKTLQSIFDMEIRKIVKNVILDIKPTAHNEETSMHITKLNEKTKYGIKMSPISIHCKIGQFFDLNMGKCISNSNSSMWFVVQSEIQSNCLGLQLNNLTIKLPSGTTIELIIDEHNGLQFKWNRCSTLLFLEKFKYKTIVEFENVN